MKLSFKAVIFDMDGLVLDSEATYALAWRQAAETMEYSLSDIFIDSLTGLHGESIDLALFKQCGIDFDIKLFKQLSGDYWRLHVKHHGIPVKKGFYSLLQVINQLDLPFCLATNSRLGNALECLELAGLTQIFPTIISRDEVALGKPAPDIFIRATKVLGVKAAECLVLEDSAVGVSAAVAAGCPCIYVPSLNPPDEWAVARALAVEQDLEQIADFILTYR